MFAGSYYTMTTFFQQVFSRSLSQTGKAPSFNDFSLHVAADSARLFLSACLSTRMLHLYRLSVLLQPSGIHFLGAIS